MLEEELRLILTPLVREVVREELASRETKRGWVSARKAAEEIGVTEAAIYKRIQRDQIPHKHIGRTVYVDLDSLGDALR